MGEGGGGWLEMVAKEEEEEVLAKGKFLIASHQISDCQGEAQGARCLKRRNAAPPSARREPPAFSSP
jgi:hypothetical protein